MGLGEIIAILIIATLVFGPERLPALAKQAAGFIKTLRQMAENAKSDLVKDFSNEFKDVDLDELRSLDPRQVVRETLLGSSVASSPVASTTGAETRARLQPGERAPYDDEAT